VYQLADAVRSAPTRDGETLLDIAAGKMFALNQAASTILGLVKRGNSPAQITAHMAREFGINPEIAQADVEEFLSRLLALKLIEEVQPPGTCPKE
jgi:hypothetical protein